MLASRNEQLVPSIARARGCVVQKDSGRLRVFVSASQASDVVEDVRGSGMLSVTFSVPSTHQTIQLKSRDARVVAVTAADRDVMQDYVAKFAHSIGVLGFSEEFTQAFFASPDDEVAIEFAPAECFEQTPGSCAGERIA